MRLLLILVAMMTFSAQSLASSMSADEFSEWLMFYYLEPDPDAITTKIKSATEQHLLDDVSKAGPPLFGFIAGAVKDNPSLAQKLVNDLSSIADPQYGMVLIGIWYANLPNNQSKQIVGSGLEKHPALKTKFPFLSEKPAPLLSMSANQKPWVLDAWWGYFAATGASEPVVRIISVLPWIHESKKSEVMSMGKPGFLLMAISGSARWSLTANARQHKRVMEICEDQISKQPEPIASQLKEIVTKAKAG